MSASFELTHARHVLRAGLVAHNNVDAAEVDVDMGYVIAAALAILEEVQTQVDALEDEASRAAPFPSTAVKATKKKRIELRAVETGRAQS